MLTAHIVLRRGDLAVDVALDAAAGETIAILGPNGAGKTTVVQAVAGLLALDAGRVEVDGQVLDDVEQGIHVPPEHRPVGVVFQDHLLFPRMSVLENVAFGLRARGRHRADARALARGWLERFGVAEYAADRPAVLSGGESQRVALARALAIDPRLLLLDEPLSALDASTRAHVRAELRRHLTTFEGARVLVTHDPLDALVLADRLVIVEAGRVTQTGSPVDVTARPATRYVADLVGINLVHATRCGDHEVSVPGGARLTVADVLPPGLGDVAVAIRPRSVALYPHRPDGSPRNTWEATVADLESDRDRVRVVLGGPVPLTAEITTGAAATLELVPGARVWASVKAVDMDVYER